MSSIEDDLKNDIIEGEKSKTELQAVVEILLNEKFKRRKTRLKDRTVPALTTIDVIAQIYDVEWLREWIDGYTEYVTSVGGKGRQEIVDITKFTIDKEAQKQQQLLEVLGRR